MQQGYVDPLTGLANRVRLHEQLTASLELDTGTGAGPAVLFIDLDGFKLVNDALGHGVGDELLVKVASGCATPWPHRRWSPGSAATSSPSWCRR